MTMEPVNSGAIKAVGYDDSTQTLTVEFKNGGIYEYGGVPAHKHQALMAADHKGQHFMRHIRYDHDFRKVS
jgi:hypothetical protein